MAEAKTNEIMMTIMTNTANVIGLNRDPSAMPPTEGSVMALMDRNTVINGEIDTVNTTIGTQTGTVATQMTNNETN